MIFPVLFKKNANDFATTLNIKFDPVEYTAEIYLACCSLLNDILFAVGMSQTNVFLRTLEANSNTTQD